MKFRHTFRVRVPLERVSNFHSDSSALEVLSPPLTSINFIEVEPLSEGSLTNFEMQIGFIKIPWLAKHTDVRLPEGFVDEQIKGPFARWTHRHSFKMIKENETEVIDEIEANFGAGFRDGLISRIMWLMVPGLFSYRGRTTRKALEE